MKDKRLTQYKDGKGKKKAHAYLNRRYKKAIENGFNFEAMMISYNLVEDRLVAFLHYAGVVNRDAEKLTIAKKIRPLIRRVLNKNEKFRINVSNIGVKLDIIEALTKMECCGDTYLTAVKEQLRKTVPIDQLFDVVNQCKKWKDTRNTYVHGLANKNPDEVEQYAKEVAEKGHEISREIDRLVDRFKANNNIRKKFNLQ